MRTVYLRLRWLADAGCIFLGHGLDNDFRMCNLTLPPAQVRAQQTAPPLVLYVVRRELDDKVLPVSTRRHVRLGRAENKKNNLITEDFFGLMPPGAEHPTLPLPTSMLSRSNSHRLIFALSGLAYARPSP